MVDNKKNTLLLQVVGLDRIGGYVFTPPQVSRDFTTLEGVLTIIADLLSYAVGLSAIIAIIMIVYSGFLYITSTGEPENISKAGKALTAAIVGMIIVFLARTIIVFILNEFLL